MSLMCPCPLPAVSGLARPAGVSLRRLAQRSKICPTFAGRSAGHTVLKCTRVACRAPTRSTHVGDCALCVSAVPPAWRPGPARRSLFARTTV